MFRCACWRLIIRVPSVMILVKILMLDFRTYIEISKFHETLKNRKVTLFRTPVNSHDTLNACSIYVNCAALMNACMFIGKRVRMSLHLA